MIGSANASGSFSWSRVGETPGTLSSGTVSGVSRDSRIAKQAAILRHLVGNPFRPYAFPANWSTPVIQLADAVYNGEPCSFALLEAGLPELADHFREAEHPKGCWVLDAILDKK